MWPYNNISYYGSISFQHTIFWFRKTVGRGDSECEFPPDFPPNVLTEKAAIEAVCGCLKDCEGEVTLWQLQMSQVIFRQLWPKEDYSCQPQSWLLRDVLFEIIIQQLNHVESRKSPFGLPLAVWKKSILVSWCLRFGGLRSKLSLAFQKKAMRRRTCLLRCSAKKRVVRHVLWKNPKERNSILGKYGWWYPHMRNLVWFKMFKASLPHCWIVLSERHPESSWDLRDLARGLWVSLKIGTKALLVDY